MRRRQRSVRNVLAAATEAGLGWNRGIATLCPGRRV